MPYHEDGFYWSRSAFSYQSEEQLTNVRYITNFLRGKGWTDNAIAGVLGNFQTESGMNPGAYYGYAEFSAVSFGLVQWDPTSKYQTWHDQTFPNVIYEHLGCQLERIIYEKENNLQYYSTDEFPVSFSAYTTSTESPDYLAKVFVRNYERPASVLYNSSSETYEEHLAAKEATYKQRGKQALTWYEYITGTAFPDNPTPTPAGKKTNILDIILWTRSRFRVVR